MKRMFLTAVSAILVITLTACSTTNLPQTSDEVTTVPTETIEETTEPTTELTNPATENTTTPSTEPSTEPPESSDNPTTNTPSTTPTITFTDVDETVYATGTVNVRSGPSTDYIKLGQLKKGNSIKRKGIGDNGWSRVEYDGQVAYIFSSYLSTTKPFSDTGSAGSPSDSNNSNGNPGSSGSLNGSSIGRADPSTGLSWDGISPIIYTYPDGTTGTEPKEGATFESVPGVISTVTTYIIPESNDSGSADGVFHCEHCGKVCGDGSDGTCVRWLVGGNHTCTCCGETVPGHTCHSCDED